MHPYSPSPPWHRPSLCPDPYPYCRGHSSSAPWLLLLLLLLPLHPQPDSNIASARLSWSAVHSSSATLLRSAVQGTAGFCPSLPCFMSPLQVTDLATRPRSFVSSLGGGNLTCACEPYTETTHGVSRCFFFLRYMGKAVEFTSSLCLLLFCCCCCSLLSPGRKAVRRVLLVPQRVPGMLAAALVVFGKEVRRNLRRVRRGSSGLLTECP